MNEAGEGDAEEEDTGAMSRLDAETSGQKERKIIMISRKKVTTRKIR